MHGSIMLVGLAFAGSISTDDSVAPDIAHAKMWQAVKDFGDPTVSRQELLRRFQWIAKHCAHSPDAPRARETAALLKKMVAEHEARERKPVKPFNQMFQRERIAELIFRLRDQNGQQFSQPGACDIFIGDEFLNNGQGKKSPAMQLVEMGYDAVPQLIDVLEDQHFTRSVGYHRDFYFSHFVLRVGDCAVAILERIAGRSFWEPKSTAAAMLKDGQGPQTKAQVEAWWKDFQQKGEKTMLIEATERGDRNSVQQAERLVSKYADHALASLRKGVAQAKEDSSRAQLVRLTGKLKGDAVIAYLREQLRNTLPLIRVAAAQTLIELGRKEGVEPMIREWALSNREEPSADLIGFLLWCGESKAVQSLAKDLKRNTVDANMFIIESIHAASSDESKGSSRSGSGLWRTLFWETLERPVPPAAEQAIDGLLVQALDDTRERTGMSGYWGDKEFNDPRLCDLSAHVLAQRWKHLNWFDLAATLKTRDKQRLELKNIWLKKQDKQVEPLPVAKKIMRLPAEKVGPLLESLEAAKSDKEASQTMERLLALGLPALPSVRERLKSIRPEAHAASPVRKAAAQLASIVDDIRFTDGSQPPTKEIKTRVEGWKGKSLQADDVVALCRRVTSALPAGVTGIKLAVDREGDDTGVNVSITLTSKRVRQEGTQKGWSTFESITINNKSIHASNAFYSKEFGVTQERWQTFQARLRQALDAGPEQSVAVRLEMVEEE